MRIDITERPAVRVAYLRYTGPFGDPVGRFWRNTVSPWLADHGLVDCPRYGVALDNPMDTPPERCRYDACVELPPGLSLPDAPERNLAGGRYAVTHFKGTGADIGAGLGRVPARIPSPTPHIASTISGRRSSTIRAAPCTMRAPACSPASCACPWLARLGQLD